MQDNKTPAMNGPNSVRMSTSRPPRRRPLSAKTLDRICVWSGAISAGLFFLIFPTAFLIPPIPPSHSAEQVVAHYKKYEKGFIGGAGLMQFTGLFYSLFVAVTSGHMARIPECTYTMLAAQSISGTISAYTNHHAAVHLLLPHGLPARQNAGAYAVNILLLED